MYSSPSFYAIENNNLPKFNQLNFKKTQKLKMGESKRGHTCLSFFTWVRRPVISSSKSACIGSIRNWISSEPPTALVLRPSLQTQTSNTTKIFIKIQSETEKKKKRNWKFCNMKIQSLYINRNQIFESNTLIDKRQRRHKRNLHTN